MSTFREHQTECWGGRVGTSAQEADPSVQAGRGDGAPRVVDAGAALTSVVATGTSRSAADQGPVNW